MHSKIKFLPVYNRKGIRYRVPSILLVYIELMCIEAHQGRILNSKTRRVKFDRTRVVSSKLANRKKVVNHLSSNKNIRKTRSRTHDGNRKARPITNHDRRRIRGVCGAGFRTARSVEQRQ